MNKYAIIDTSTNKVINVVEYDVAPSNPPPGFAAGIIAVQSSVADTSWTWNGTALVAPILPTPPPPVPSCQLWQLQAVMTAAQWSAAQSAVDALNNPAVTAFFAHGTNVIPANSVTLLQLAETLGMTAEQISALVAQAALVSIP